MSFDEFKQYVSILSQNDSYDVRDLYINAFIDTSKICYQDTIATTHEFSDGWHYTGYLWDCLIKYEQISIYQLKARLKEFSDVIIFWDNHSCDRIVASDYWKFPKDRAIKATSNILAENLSFLPEDIYICNFSFEWTLVLTHEEDGKRRICYIIDKKIK